ncbi:MAG: ATPase P [bacterium]|nr:ATPase P [bacterium]
MIDADIPGFKKLSIKNIICDYNGTLAIDGIIIPDVKPLIEKLSERTAFHIVTGDTFGTATENLKNLPVTVKILTSINQDQQKLEYLKRLGTDLTVCIGNGRNDKLMLEKAVLGICLIQAEGSSFNSLLKSDIICTSAKDALNILLEPKKLIATLRK